MFNSTKMASTQIKSLDMDRIANIIKYIHPREWMNLASASSEWNECVDKLCFSKITCFQSVNLNLSELWLHPRVLSSRDGLDLFKQVAPHLQSILIRPHFDEKPAYLLFESYFFEVRDFYLSDLFEIICSKCVNLEVISIDTHTLTTKVMTEIVRNNPKLKVLNVEQNAIREILPQGAKIPTLQQIFLHGSYKDVKGFSLLSEQLTVIDMSGCNITPEDLPELMQEIFRHTDTLKCLRMNLIVSNSQERNCSELVIIGMCPSLMVLSINVEEKQYLPGYFFANIIAGCRNLQSVYLKNVAIDEDTYNRLISMPCMDEAVVNCDFEIVRQRSYKARARGL